MRIPTFNYSVLVFLAVSQALAGETATNAWGPLTNEVQLGISAVAPRTYSPWGYFSVDGSTNSPPLPPVGEKAEIKVGQPFSLLVRLRNLSTNETYSIYCEGVIPDEDLGLGFVVISPSGKDVSPRIPTNYHVAVLSLNSGFGATARPNETALFEFPLSRLLEGHNVFPLDQPCKLEAVGTYKITVRKRIHPKAGKEFVLTSNTLYVSVVPNK
jgi:hypothetical protein